MGQRLAALCVLFALPAFAQLSTPSTPTAQVTVPHLIRISGQMPAANHTVGVTFSLYKSQTDTAPLWTETQNITPDASGKYTAVVGVTKMEGVPLELFASGEARWLGIRREGQAEQPRILLVSVPYAMKAAEAETLEGHSAAEFVTQQNLGAAIQLKLQEPEIRTVLANPFASESSGGTSGATNFIDTTSNQIISVTQNGTGRLITGEGPSHAQVFAVDQTGEIHGTGLSLDGSAGRSISMGNNAASGGTGYQLLIRAGAPASGSTNKRGGELQLAAGPGTGTGGSGDVVIQTGTPGVSGTTVNPLVSRHVYASSPVNMGAGAGTADLATVAIPSGAGGGLGIRYKIYASDGTANWGTSVGECIIVSYVNDAGDSSMAYVVQEDTAEISAGDGVINPACSYYETGLGTVGPEIKDNPNFTPTVHTITYEIENFSEWPLQLVENKTSTVKMPLPEGALATPTHPSFKIRHDANGVLTVVEDPKKR